MALQRQASLFILVCVSLVNATFFKVPPPAFNGCYKGRSDGSINVQAVFDMGGVRGYIQFYQPARGEPTEINVNLQGLDQFGGFYDWHAHEYPVRTSLLKDFPCSNEEIGGHYDPTNAIANPNYTMICNTGNQGACQIGDFSGKHGFLRNDQQFQSYVDRNLNLFGPMSIIGRAVAIHYPNSPNRFICANIEPIGCNVKNLRAEFNNGVLQGEVVIRYASGQDTAKIFVDLYQVDNTFMVARNKQWTLHFGQSGDGNSCDNIRSEIAGDSNLHDFPECTALEHRRCRFGDLITKCGPLRVGEIPDQRRIRLCCTDAQLGLIPFDTLFSPRNNHYVSVRIADEGVARPDGCAQFEKVVPQVAKAKFSTKDLIGTVIFYQASPLDRTFIQPTIESIRQRNISLLIRNSLVVNPKDCRASTLGPIFSKPLSPIFGRPLPSSGIKTGDASLIGNLDSAIDIPDRAQRHVARSSSHYAPLFGPHSIIGHSLVVVQNNADGTQSPLACGNIVRTSEEPSGVFASFTGYRNK